MKNISKIFTTFAILTFTIHLLYSQQLLKGPYIQNIRKNQATICWVTQEGQVKYGEHSTTLNKKVTEFKVHHIQLKDLSPNTTYFYNIGFGDQGKAQFKTAPELGAPFRFVVLGDTRYDLQPREVQKKIIAAVEKKLPALVINTGDLVTDGLNPIHWDTFFKMNRNLLKSVPYYVSLGNHEKNSSLFYKYFSFPKNENYFSFTWSNCHFVILDSEGPHFAPEFPPDYRQRKKMKQKMDKFWEKQLNWFCRDMKNHQKYDFHFVFMHQPLFSLKESRRNEQKEFQKRFAQLFEDFGVNIVFSGHDHSYQRHFVNPVHYVVTAGGGASLYEMGKPFAKYTRKISLKHHYLLVEVHNKQLQVKAISSDGETIDQFSIPFDNRTDSQKAEKELHLSTEGTYDTWF